MSRLPYVRGVITCAAVCACLVLTQGTSAQRSQAKPEGPEIGWEDEDTRGGNLVELFIGGTLFVGAFGTAGALLNRLRNKEPDTRILKL